MNLHLTESQLNLLDNLVDNYIHERCQYAEDAEQHGEDIKDTLKHIKAVQVLHTKISKLRKVNKWKVWEVYKADDKGSSWKWVARTEKEIHVFPTKGKAVAFVKEQSEEIN